MGLIQCTDVCKSFGEKVALDHVSVDIPKGKIFGLLGPNGAGKTTLIRIINRITIPNSGTVLFDGRPITQDDVEKIGYLPEERGLYRKMKVGEQAMYLAQLKGKAIRGVGVAPIGLGDVLVVAVGELSFDALCGVFVHLLFIFNRKREDE